MRDGPIYAMRMPHTSILNMWTRPYQERRKLEPLLSRLLVSHYTPVGRLRLFEPIEIVNLCGRRGRHVGG